MTAVRRHRRRWTLAALLLLSLVAYDINAAVTGPNPEALWEMFR